MTLDPNSLVDTFHDILEEHVGEDGRTEICEVITGNINCICKIKYAGRYFGARISTNQYRFKYEKDIIKEVFAICLLNNVQEGFYDAATKDLFGRLLKSATGSHLGHESIRRIVYYDWTRRRLPYPFFVYEWLDGDTLWEIAKADYYFLAGRDLAQLHRITFEHYYQDLFKIGRAPLDWASNFRLSLDRELALAERHLPASLAAKIKSLDISRTPSCRPSLVHNDYSGGNIIVLGDDRRKIIDWDNWVVESPELDLVKMKYWTAIAADGLLAHHEDFHRAFLEGYRSVKGASVDEDRFRAYEYLWLVRTYNFETAKEEDKEEPRLGTSWARYYPPPSAYEGYLRDL